MKALLTFLGLSVFLSNPSTLDVEALNVLYLGLDNPISISHPKYACERLKVVLEPESLAVLEPYGCGSYLVRLRKRDRKGLKIKVYKDRVKPKNLLSEQTFRTLKVPSLVSSVNGLTGPYISKTQLAAASKIDVELPGFAYAGTWYEVSSFDYIFKPKKGIMIRGTVHDSNTFPKEMQEAFKSAQEEDVLIVSGIYAIAPGLGKVPLAGSLVFTVKGE